MSTESCIFCRQNIPCCAIRCIRGQALPDSGRKDQRESRPLFLLHAALQCWDVELLYLYVAVPISNTSLFIPLKRSFHRPSSCIHPIWRFPMHLGPQHVPIMGVLTQPRFYLLLELSSAGLSHWHLPFPLSLKSFLCTAGISCNQRPRCRG